VTHGIIVKIRDRERIIPYKEVEKEKEKEEREVRKEEN